MRHGHPFLERLARGPILCDGAMGSLLYARGIPYEHCFEDLNLTDPERVTAIHLDYIAAGAEIIETNTFGANRFKLADHGLEDKVRRLNRAGAKLAREARDVSGQAVFLAGSIGPLGHPLAPVGRITAADARAAFQEQAEGLLESGVDLLIVETIADLAEMREALAAIRGLSDLPLVAQMTFGEDGATSSGEDPATIARILLDVGADVVGINCALGPAGTLDVIAAMHAGYPEAPLAAQPNAGLPRRVNDRLMYVATPEYFADHARRFLATGALLVGGCCGTTPQHIAAMATVVREQSPQPMTEQKLPAYSHVSQRPEPAETGSVSRAPTHLAQLFQQRRFVVSTEMRPPRGVKFRRFLENAAYLREHGTDVINIPDNAMAQVRMSNLAAARLIQEHAGIETIVHFTPRDRNLMAVQSDLLGAHATGIRNVLAITGDPPSQADVPRITGNWDVDSIGLIAILRNMNRGLDSTGRKLGDPTAFFIGCAATPSAVDLNLDLERLHRKIEAGAQFIMTQPVFDAPTLVDYFARYEAQYGPIAIPIMVGLQPLHSYRMAEKFHNEVPGIVIPDAVRERMRQAGERSAEIGLAIARDLIDALHPHVQGAYIFALDRYDLATELIAHISAAARTGS